MLRNHLPPLNCQRDIPLGHTDPKRPSGARVVNIDRIGFDESGRLKIIGPTRSPPPMPSGCP